jgi:arginine decarboxylase
MKSEPSTAWNLSRQSARTKLPPLIQALKDYDQHQRRRFHVPAHAGFNLPPLLADIIQDPYRYDLTELEGLDVLSEPSGCILKAQQRVAELFNVAHSYFLVNGASVGLMAAMLATIKPGDKVLLPRNVHRSVLSGLILTGAQPIWFLPQRLPEWGLWGAVTVEQVTAQLDENPDAKALFVTSPTYEGIGSNIGALAALCRERDVYLVVDEAHGSLWPFSEGLPASACTFACDAVIHSMHKSGGSLTQGALAHLPYNSRINPAVFQQALNTLHTTSPSYLLMASLEGACDYLASTKGQANIQYVLAQVRDLRGELKAQLNTFSLFEPSSDTVLHWDPCKLYLTHPTIPGEEWGPEIETDRQIAYESASPYGVLYLAGLGLQSEDFKVFQQVLVEEDTRLSADSPPGTRIQTRLEKQNPSILIPETGLSPRDAFFSAGISIPTTEAIGRIAKETVVHCPPGIPILLQGERISEAHLPFLPQDGLLVVQESQ